MLVRSGADESERGNEDGDSERRGGGSKMSRSPAGKTPGCNTGLVNPFPFALLPIFFEHPRLWIPAAESSYRWE